LLVSAKTGAFLEKILRLAAGNVMITDVDPHNLASILPLARPYGASLALQLQGTEEDAAIDGLLDACREAGIPAKRISLDLGRALEKNNIDWLRSQAGKGFPLLVQQEADVAQDFSLLSELPEKIWIAADFTDEKMSGIL